MNALTSTDASSPRSVRRATKILLVPTSQSDSAFRARNDALGFCVLHVAYPLT